MLHVKHFGTIATPNRTNRRFVFKTSAGGLFTGFNSDAASQYVAALPHCPTFAAFPRYETLHQGSCELDQEAVFRERAPNRPGSGHEP
jgi:hypothetical protein